MAQYAILLFAKAPADAADLTPQERQAHDRHGEDVERFGGTMLAAYALEPSTTATSVHGDVVTDGPFLDAKEVVAGFYVIEAPDLDAALEIARRNPATQQGGGVEVRPVAAGFPTVPPARR
ncbi:YciI family protein [Micromonospora sp. NBC_01699]|uniref:YciI family protein n=1 Tax=Micromonospora sp. NBC_01699 TaxID=2975984 RepID=UPI002E35858A|nr:YciI family protein [Micromonospora sp. NBC_01699]